VTLVAVSKTVPADALRDAVAAGLGGPLAYSINTAATAHTGALPSAGPAVAAGFGPGRFGPGGFGGFGNRFRGVTGGQFPGGGGAAGLEEALAGQAHLVHAGAGRAGPVFRYQP